MHVSKRCCKTTGGDRWKKIPSQPRSSVAHLPCHGRNRPVRISSIFLSIPATLAPLPPNYSISVYRCLHFGPNQGRCGSGLHKIRDGAGATDQFRQWRATVSGAGGWQRILGGGEGISTIIARSGGHWCGWRANVILCRGKVEYILNHLADFYSFYSSNRFEGSAWCGLEK
jgi:hypothetical protein